jgi:hypothetical protein
VGSLVFVDPARPFLVVGILPRGAGGTRLGRSM